MTRIRGIQNRGVPGGQTTDLGGIRRVVWLVLLAAVVAAAFAVVVPATATAATSHGGDEVGCEYVEQQVPGDLDIDGVVVECDLSKYQVANLDVDGGGIVGTVEASGHVSIDNATIEGDIQSGDGDVDISNSVVLGNTSAEGDVAVQNATVNGSLESVSGDLDINEGAVFGNTSGEGDVTVRNVTVEGSLVSVGGNLDIDDGEVSGDASAEGDVDIQAGTVEGTLVSDDGDLTVDGGTVGSDASASGDTDVQNATVGGNLTSGGDLDVHEAGVLGSASAEGDASLQDATVEGDVVSNGGDLDIDTGSVGGNASAGGNADVRNVTVGGDLESGGDLDINQGNVSGSVAGNGDVDIRNGTINGNVAGETVVIVDTVVETFVSVNNPKDLQCVRSLVNGQPCGEYKPGVNLRVNDAESGVIRAGESVSAVLEGVDVETLTVNAGGDYNASAAGLFVAGKEVAFGDPVEFDSFDGTIPIVIETAPDTVGALNLMVTATGPGEDATMALDPILLEVGELEVTIDSVDIVGSDSPGVYNDILLEYTVENVGGIATQGQLDYQFEARNDGVQPIDGTQGTVDTPVVGSGQAYSDNLSYEVPVAEAGDIHHFNTTLASNDSVAHQNKSITPGTLDVSIDALSIVESSSSGVYDEVVMDYTVENVGDLATDGQLDYQFEARNDGLQPIDSAQGTLTTSVLESGQASSDTFRYEVPVAEASDIHHFNTTLSSPDDVAYRNRSITPGSLEVTIDALSIVESSSSGVYDEVVMDYTVENIGDLATGEEVGYQFEARDDGLQPVDSAQGTVTVPILESGQASSDTFRYEVPVSEAGNIHHFNTTLASADDIAHRNRSITPGSLDVTIDALSIVESSSPGVYDEVVMDYTVENIGDLATDGQLDYQFEARNDGLQSVDGAQGSVTTSILKSGQTDSDTFRYEVPVAEASDIHYFNTTVVSPDDVAHYNKSITPSTLDVTIDDLGVVGSDSPGVYNEVVMSYTVENVGDLATGGEVDYQFETRDDGLQPVDSEQGSVTVSVLESGQTDSGTLRYEVPVSEASDIHHLNTTLTSVDDVAHRNQSITPGSLDVDIVNLGIVGSGGGDSYNELVLDYTVENVGDLATDGQLDYQFEARNDGLQPVDSAQDTVTVPVLESGQASSDTLYYEVPAAEAGNIHHLNTTLASADDVAHRNRSITPATFEVVITDTSIVESDSSDAYNTVEVDYEIQNIGDLAAEQNVSRNFELLNGSTPVKQASETTSVTINSGGTSERSFSYDVPPSDGGDVDGVSVSVDSGTGDGDSSGATVEPGAFDPAQPGGAIVDSGASDAFEEFLVEYTVTNSGSLGAEQAITIEAEALDGSGDTLETETTDRVYSLAAGESTEDEYALPIPGGIAGSVAELNVTIIGDDGAAVASRSVDPAEFVVSGVTESSVTVGEDDISVPFTVTNEGELTSSQTVELIADGTEQGTSTRVLAGGESTSETLVAFADSSLPSGDVTLTVGPVDETDNGDSVTITIDDSPDIDKLTFTTCGLSGRYGPDQSDCNSAYSGTPVEETGGVNVVGEGIQKWEVPETGTYRVTAYGAEGGGEYGGKGAKIRGEFDLQEGEVLEILVGQVGAEETRDRITTGGGGSFVVEEGGNSESDILVIAGGGGGASVQWDDSHGQAGTTGGDGRCSGTWYCGNGASNGQGTTDSGGIGSSSGAAGFLGDGDADGSDPKAYVNGGLGAYESNGYSSSEGGFGGGGAGSWNNDDVFWGGGPGGGYSAGGGSVSNTPNLEGGGGGGSYNNGDNQNNIAGGNTGSGTVVIEPVGGGDSGDTGDDGVVLYEQDFGDYDTGSFPDDWSRDGNSDQNIVSGPSLSGDRALRFSGSSGGCWEAISNSPAIADNLTSDGTTVVEGAVRAGSGSWGCHDSTVDFKFRTTGGCGWSCGSNRGLFSFDQSGEITAAGTSLGDWSHDEWYEFTVEYERSGDDVSYTVSINGQETTVDADAAGFEDDLDRLMISTGGFTNYVDDLKITRYEG